MSSIKFSVYETPKPDGRKGKNLQHARIQSQGTKRLDDICEHISDVSSLCSSDVKGALEAFFKYISFQLRYGYTVELDGIGHFSVALKSKEGVNTKGKKVMYARIDGVNFRCSPRLKEEVQSSSLKKVKRSQNSFPDQDKRKDRLVAYLNKHGMITIREYARMNGCSRYCANRDIKKFAEDKLIAPNGSGTHKVYILAG